MHEMSLAEGIREIVDEAVRTQRLGRVRTVVVEIGELSSVEPEALAFCFDEVMRGGPAEGARMEVVGVAGSGLCLQCHQTVAMHRLYDACPACGSYQLQPRDGMEMRVKEIEVE